MFSGPFFFFFFAVVVVVVVVVVLSFSVLTNFKLPIVTVTETVSGLSELTPVNCVSVMAVNTGPSAYSYSNRTETLQGHLTFATSPLTKTTNCMSVI